MIRKRETLLYNRLLEFLDVYKSKIPKELEEEIYLAEANTEAAKDRGQRVALYIVLSIVGVSIASFNGFLTEMRSDSNFSDLEQARFNWVGANPIFSFFLTTRLGGGIGLLCGGASGLLGMIQSPCVLLLLINFLIVYHHRATYRALNPSFPPPPLFYVCIVET